MHDDSEYNSLNVVYGSLFVHIYHLVDIVFKFVQGFARFFQLVQGEAIRDDQALSPQLIELIISGVKCIQVRFTDAHLGERTRDKG